MRSSFAISAVWYNGDEGSCKYAQISKPDGKGGQMKDHHGCPVQATINVLSGKWKVQILWHLSFGPLRFAEIRDKLFDISEKVLTDQLRQLEQDGVIQRYSAQSVPPMVTYSLNAEGEKLVPMMESLCDWGCAHFQMKPNLPRTTANVSFSG
jgi:DNA-binding HxlR family transcriptional regulator